MNVQQLLSQCSVEDIVRATMEIYDVDDVQYQGVYANYARLIESLLELEPVPTDDVLLGIVCEEDGELDVHTTLYNADQLARGIPYSAILEKTVDPVALSDEMLDATIGIKGWPDSYTYMFSPREEIMGFQVNEVNLEDVGMVPLLVDILYEVAFFGFDEADMEAERHNLDEAIAEMEAIEALPPEEQKAYYFCATTAIDDLRVKYGLPIQSSEEKTQEHQALRHQLFRDRQRLYRALRAYGGHAKRNTFEIQGCISIEPDMTHDEFMEAFLEFIASKGWSFGGGTKEVEDDTLDIAGAY